MIDKNITKNHSSSKTALITGASRGIGRAIALKFAREGYHLIINCAHNLKLLESLKAEVSSYGVQCMSFRADVGEMEQCETMFAEAMKVFSGLDVLINNAGISYIGLLQDMGVKDWDALMHTNLYSVFHCSKLAIPLMLKKGRGKIINISSVWGKNGASCEVAYSASKGAVNAFTRALGKELAPSNIQVNAVACGAIETDMNAFLDPDEFCSLSNEIPAGRLGKSAEVAELVFQLASSTSYLNAQIINLDGAWQ
ncbi:MAG: SDR family NAD(P)-dependent oxidoreductase [Johnsonella sp.]|nr:SDR family NAD(P)-dependent oxidoreductase [Johnsonella sp.]